MFKGQCTNDVLKLLEENNIQFVIVPTSNCTDRLQPLDLTVNKSVKTFMQVIFNSGMGMLYMSSCSRALLKMLIYDWKS